MKSFLKFLALTILPLAIVSLSSIVFYRNLDDFKNTDINIHIILIFATLSFVHVYLLNHSKIKKKSIISKLVITSIAVFLIIFTIGVLFSSPNVVFRTIYIALFQGILGICLYLLEYLVLNYCLTFNRTKRLFFTDNARFYVKVLFLICFFESIILLFLTFDIFMEQNSIDIFITLLKPIIMVPLIINFISFYCMNYLNKFNFFKSKITLLLIISIFASTFSIQILRLFNFKFQIHANYLFLIFSVFSTLLIFKIIDYRDSLNLSLNKIKSLSNDIVFKNADYYQLKQQVNPHFLFNNLNTLISFIEIDQKKAIEFGHHLANTYRHYLKNNNEEFVLLNDELEFINDYLAIYKSKFESSFNYNIEASPKPNQYILTFVLQEIIDNIFKHNILVENEPLEIIISINEENLIINNSFNPKETISSSGMGLNNIKKRYEFHSKNDVIWVKENNNFEIQLPILILN
jgi:sensor histidine kinase YesM